MNILFLILTSINAIIFMFTLLKDIVIIIEHETFKKIFVKSNEFAKKVEEDILGQEKNNKKTKKIIGYILVIIILAAFYLGTIAIPIIIGLKVNIEVAIATYLGMLLITTLPRLYAIATNDKTNVKHLLLVSLNGLFKFQMIIIILFGLNFSLETIINNIYNSGFLLANTLTILTPILFFSSIIITLYLYWKAILIYLNKINIEKKRPRLSDTLLIIVASSIVGLIVLFEMNLNTKDNVPYNKILELVLIILGSIFIPSLFSFFTKKNHQVIKSNRRRTKYKTRNIRKYRRK